MFNSRKLMTLIIALGLGVSVADGQQLPTDGPPRESGQRRQRNDETDQKGATNGKSIARALSFIQDKPSDLSRTTTASSVASLTALSEIFNAVAPRFVDSKHLMTHNELNVVMRAKSFHFRSRLNLESDVTDDDLDQVAQRCPFLKYLNLSWNQNITHVGFGHIAKMRYLHELNLSFTNLDDACLRAIIDGCLPHDWSYPGLEILDLSGCRRLTAQGIAAIVELKNLKELRIGLTATDNAGLMAIVNGCPKLRQVDVSGCDQLTNLTFTSDTLITLCLIGCGRLTHLEVRSESLREFYLSWCHRFVNSINITPSLETLDLSQCYGLTDGGLDEMTKNCPKLKKLSVLRCDRISGNQAVQAIIQKNCPKLESWIGVW